MRKMATNISRPALLTAAADHSGPMEGTAGFYRAMSLFGEGKSTEARALFTATEAAMIEVANEAQLDASKLQVRDLILLIREREARLQAAR